MGVGARRRQPPLPPLLLLLLLGGPRGVSGVRRDARLALQWDTRPEAADESPFLSWDERDDAEPQRTERPAFEGPGLRLSRLLLDLIARSPAADAVRSWSPPTHTSPLPPTPTPPTLFSRGYMKPALAAARWWRSHVLAPSLRPLVRALRYKPPLGPVAVLLSLSKLRRRSILEDAAAFFPRSRAARSLDLDMGDREYALAGGVAAERAALCARQCTSWRAAARAARAGRNATDTELAEDAYCGALLDALQLNCPPRGARGPFVCKSAEALCRLHELGKAARWHATGSWLGLSHPKPRLFGASELVVELRATDALLRVLRERLLETAKELQQAERRALAGARRGGLRLTQRRDRLARTSCQYQAQLERVGRVQAALLMRPSLYPHGMDAAAGAAAPDRTVAADEWEDEARRWAVDARAVLSDVIGGATDQGGQTADTRPCATARVAACEGAPAEAEAVAEIVEAEAVTSDARFKALSAWRRPQGKGVAHGEELLAALALVEDLPRAQRMLLARQLVLRTRAARQAMSVPFSLATLGLAYGAHCVISPRWDAIHTATIALGSLGLDILRQKFYGPLRKLLRDLLTRSQRLTDDGATEDAETSLDNMLRDLTGDGSNRTEAIAAASRLYEAGLRAGTLKNLLSGKMLRLLLIQMQLLKLQTLRAMGTLDDLVDTNRLNVSLFATLPALLLAFIAWKTTLAAVYAVRARGLRSTKDVHAEMSDTLLRMERSLLLANAQAPRAAHAAAAHATMAAVDAVGGSTPTDRADESAGRWWWFARQPPRPALNPVPLVLRGAELGEFCLLLHSYLRMLDFSTPPLSSKAADAIHRELQELLWGQLSTSRQHAMLRSVATRHARLLRGKVGATLDKVSAA